MITRALAQRASAQRFEGLPPDVVRLAAQCLLDWMGVTLAARTEPAVDMIYDLLLDEGGAAQSGLVGRPGRFPATRAAFFNGVAGHAIDYDDVSAIGHPTAPLAPVVLALGERIGASGSAIINAFVAGYETETRIGRFMGPSHYARGWHSTATFGAFGAAAAAASLLGLDELRTRHAFGIAGTQAAGLKAVFGSMAKPLHAGHAAETGLCAAMLAARGFTSSPDILEAEQGFGATQSEATDTDAALADPPQGFHIFGNLFKYHAACYLTHSSIEALLFLRSEGLAADEVEAVELSVAPEHLGVCNIAEPQDGLQVKFSLRHLAALTLEGVDTADPAVFRGSAAFTPRILALRDRVTVVTRSQGTHAEARVHCRGGGLRMAGHDVAVPLSDLGRQQAKLEAKFRSIVDSGFDRDAILAEFARFAHLETLAPLMALVAPPSAPGSPMGGGPDAARRSAALHLHL